MLAQKGGEKKLRHPYASPTLATLGRLEELTLGVSGHSPDVLGVNNDNCLTGTATNTASVTVTIGCASGPLHS